MDLPFSKYQGAGNDFVMIDQVIAQYLSMENRELIARICDRHFGIGGDGLIWIEENGLGKYKMVYFNADGGLGSMCGNGGRCFAQFAKDLGYVDDEITFEAYDGFHTARVEDSSISLSMNPVDQIRAISDFEFELNTGSPHYIDFQSDISTLDIFTLGRKIRYSDLYKAKGINVNFVQETNGALSLATYERGVEAETLACGTGVTAAALAFGFKNGLMGTQQIAVKAKGGDLIVRFDQHMPGKFQNIWLTGPAEKVFDGVYRYF